jgi:hypothetical protein
MKNNTTKFHPMLYATPMVQAILEGRKYQTRRTKGLESINEKPDAWEFWRFYDGYAKFAEEHNSINEKFIKCPYELGDVLWVRETFGIGSRGSVIYKANYDDTQFNSKEWKWKPSLFMPKQACRIFLKIKSIRVERLQDISEYGSIAEGVIQEKNGQWRNYLVPQTFWTYAKYSFETLWISINGKESMNKNPFVWVYEFEKIDKPLDFTT